jgi:hypothetical protein
MHKSAGDGQLMEENYEGTKAECGGWEQRHWGLLAAPLTFRVEKTQSDLVPFCSIPLLASFYCARAVNSKHNSFVQGDNSSPISFLVTFLVCAHTHSSFHPAPSISHFLLLQKTSCLLFAKLISVRWCFSFTENLLI